MKPTTLTFNGRSSVEEWKGVENVYTGLADDERASNKQPKYFESPSPTSVVQGAGAGAFPSSFATTDPQYQRKYRSFNKYGPKKSKDPRRSLPKPRPKPLQLEHEKYYDHIFPKHSYNDVYYQPNSLDHAEL
ncbi:PREDICTED: uncharacterized protein LOC108560027 [Nicrophorus vespilloides]|uniref:Uncharacterized protein LOC108560027 n=1 Tax=Nicrophorus vespilloides TaxID=110193 RepID=A0ABM1MED3_NICVS|nr:PREDICTED: uncharacterized protein LOC108560027 [Nicrophorus vespilloides]